MRYIEMLRELDRLGRANPPLPVIPVRPPTPAETRCAIALRSDAKTHIGRIGSR